MAYKNALAGLDLGGGKAVIWGDPEQIKTEALLRAYGRFVESLGGRYYTACDVGTYSAGHGHRGPGDPLRHRPQRRARRLRRLVGPHRLGVFQGMRAAAEHLWGAPTLAGRRVGIAGVGKVGRYLTDHLLDDGAEVVVDRRQPGGARVRSAPPTPRSTLVDDTAALVASDIDVYAPCALGGALNDDTVPALRAKIVAGGANNQLAHPGIEKLLADRGILYAPDYVVNSGGVIQVADEIEGFNFDRAKGRADKDLRHHAADPASWPTPRASRRPSPPTGWPSAGWPRSAGYATIHLR